MKEIISLKKEVCFNTYIDEVTSISLDHRINTIINNEISGVFDLYLEYRENDVSINTVSYSNKIPFSINLDAKYNLDNVTVLIDDFYYEILDKKLILNVDLLVDNLNILEDVRKDIKIEDSENITDLFYEKETTSELNLPLFETFNVEKETFVTYKVHIVKENETIENICSLYEINKKDIEDYNEIKEIKIGDKLIIPTYKK